MAKTVLSIIIPSYNTRNITKQCISGVVRSIPSLTDSAFEIIIVDNASSDGSKEMLQKIPNEYRQKKNISIKNIFLSENIGYSKANNKAIVQAKGAYLLFLNSDIIVDNVDFNKILSYLDKDRNIGALTVRVNLLNGSIDPASHRGFPTIWRSFCYFFKLEALFKNIPYLNSAFGGYHLTACNLATIHEIDSPSGAFYLTRKDIVDKIGGFDERFFMYGEDLDLSFRIKQSGYAIVYYPIYHVTHLKYVSGLKTANTKTRTKTKEYFYDAMKIFYTKHYAPITGSIINSFMYFFIDCKKWLS